MLAKDNTCNIEIMKYKSSAYQSGSQLITTFKMALGVSEMKSHPYHRLLNDLNGGYELRSPSELIILKLVTSSILLKTNYEITICS